MKRIFIFLLLILGLISSVNALNDDTISYWSLDNILTDSTTNGNNLINSGTATYTTSGKIEGAFNFDGINDYMTSPNYNNYFLNTNSWSLSLWVELDSFADLDTFFSNVGVASNGVALNIDALGKPEINLYDGSRVEFTSTTALTLNTFQHLVFIRNGTESLKIYLDNNLILNTSSGTIISSSSEPTLLGAWYVGGRYIDGTLDEISFFDIALTSEDVNLLYNLNNGLQFPFTVLTPPQINSDVQTYYSGSNITINLNTSTNTNMSYILDKGIETFICNDCNITTLNLNSLSETLHNITFISTDINGKINNTKTFIINPFQTFYFYDSLRSLNVTNFYLDNILYTNFANLRYNNFIEDENSLTFIKEGYNNQTITFNISLQTPLNQTFNVTPSNLFFTLKDFSTLSSISNWQLTIKQNNIIISNQNVTNTFQLFYNETYKDDLEFIFQKTGYNPSYYYIDFQSGSSVTETIYLLNSSATTLMPIIIKDILATSYIEGASVNLYGIKENTEYFIDEQISDDAGKVYFTLNDDFLYKVIVSKNGYVTTNYKISPTETSYTFLIKQDETDLDYIFAGFSYSLDLYDLNNVSYIRARYTDEDSLINKVTLNYLSLSNYSLISSTDTLLIPINNSLSKYNVHLEVIRNGEIHDFYKTFTNEELLINSSSSLNATKYVPDQEDKTIITLFIVFATILVGFLMFGQVGGYLGAFISLISLWYLSILSIYLAMPLILFVLLMFGFFRGGDY